MKRLLAALVMLAGVAPLPAAFGASLPAPAPVSPGRPGEVVTAPDRCPTFSWSLAPEATGYEVVVFDVDREAADQPVPVLQIRLPVGVTSWTPDRSRCPGAGTDHAWIVRARGEDGPGPWSEPRLFRVPASDLRVEEAVAVLRRFLQERGAVPEAAIGAAGSEGEPSTPAAVRPPGPLVPDIDTGVAAVRAELADVEGSSLGVVGVSHSADGAGLAARNSAGGADLLLDGGVPAVVTEEGVDRPSADPQTFDVQNSGVGAMTLEVDGVPVVTEATDQDTLGGLSCGADEVAQWSGSVWACAAGTGSGLDADLLDGLDSTDFVTDVLPGTGIGVTGSGDKTVSVQFAGSGSAGTAAHSDHTHPNGIAAVFQHTVTVANTSFYISNIDNAATNSHPNARLFVTRRMNDATDYLSRHYAVVYTSLINQWGIAMQDGNPPQVGDVFNVLVIYP